MLHRKSQKISFLGNRDCGKKFHSLKSVFKSRLTVCWDLATEEIFGKMREVETAKS